MESLPGSNPVYAFFATLITFHPSTGKLTLPFSTGTSPAAANSVTVIFLSFSKI